MSLEMQKWSVVVLDDGSPHLHAFDELAAGVHSALVDLHAAADEAVLWGNAARLRETAAGRWIVFGAMRQPWTPLPYDAVLYNTEQRGSPWLRDAAVLALYRRHVVWDYSAVNVAALLELGVSAVHVPFCWYEGIERMANMLDPEFDVIHVGTLNDRRGALLAELQGRGLCVYSITGLYGSIRDGLVARSKVLVNVHFYGEDGVYEAARVVYAAANGVAVVSERSAGGETTPGIVECVYGELVDEVERLVHDDARRAAVVEEQYAGVCGLAPRMATRIAAADRESTILPPTVVLSMVSTDEPDTIERALRSARPYIHAWCVSFNGVGQETRERICAAMEGLPGEIIDRPWVSYGHNRTEALKLAAEWGTHALVLDADEIVEAGPSPLPVNLDCDGWECSELQGEIVNPKLRLVRLSDRWRYVGAVHELLQYDGRPLVGALPGLKIRNVRDGAGSKVVSADRYRAEAATLRAEVETTGDPRAQFYLAQSLDCAGEWFDAAVEYGRRADMSGGFIEEAWMSLVRVGAIYTRVEGAEHLVAGALLRAYQARPTRAEPLLYLARWYRARGEAHIGLLFARRAAGMAVPETDRLFVERSAHAGGWQALDELALCLGATGDHGRAASICQAALAAGAPEGERVRLRKNLEVFQASAAKVS